MKGKMRKYIIHKDIILFNRITQYFIIYAYSNKNSTVAYT